MIPTAPDSQSLVSIIEDLGLYTKLIQQLNKDFQMSGVAASFDLTITPSTLPVVLSKLIEKLLVSNFEAYLQVLYRVDVSETSMQSNTVQGVEHLSNVAAYKILHREWQKVYFRNKFE